MIVSKLKSLLTNLSRSKANTTAFTPPMYSSGFTFSKVSENNLAKAHPLLKQCVEEALKISKVDFKVGEVARTKTRQATLVATGKSQTMRSRHLINPKDGKAYACDLYAVVNGKPNYDWQYYYEICKAMQLACKKLGVHLVWGGNWNIDLNVSVLEPKEIHKLYKGTLHDGVHFEMSRKYYGEY
jgi:peptidoglycan L-alanyl-D-glutamate endopeptidase CwlK